MVSILTFCPEQDNKLLNLKRALSRKVECSFRVYPNRVSPVSTQSVLRRKELVSMPDIRRMGDDFVVAIKGELFRFESYSAAYAAWEENQ